MKDYRSHNMNVNIYRERFLRRSLGGFLLCILHLSLFTLWSCDDYDSFTTDRSSTLTFSTDSIVFDTLISTIPSATKTLAVYNRADKGLRISEVWLENGSKSHFRVNIDGQDLTATKARRATDFEVRRRDSIIVRAEVTLPESNSDVANKFEDALLFRLENGMEQRVPLIATALNAFFMRGVTIQADTTFTPQRPIVIYDSLIVAPDVTLTLEAGTQLLFHQESGLTVRGRLIARGTIERPVVFRTDRTDHIFDYLPYDRLPSRWEGLRFTAESFGNQLQGTDIHGGNYGIICDSTGLDDLKLTLVDCRIHNFGGDGLHITDAHCVVSNSEISNTSGHCVRLLGGSYAFTHCTLAQFSGFGDALNIANVDQGVYHPLTAATFESCVITGYAEDVVMGLWIDTSELSSDEAAAIGTVADAFLFDHCFLATEIPTEGDYADRFINCVYDDPEAEFNHEKNFTTIDRRAFLYDFTPLEESPIRGTAKMTSRDSLPNDLRGHSRFADEQPDAGAYEFVKVES